MSKVDLISRGWCDIVFEGRNKDYGAYKMRSRAGSRNLRAVIIVFLLIVAVAAFLAAKAVITEMINKNKVDESAAVELKQLDKKEPEKEKEKEVEIKYEEQKPVEQVAVKASMQFTVPKIEDDALVKEDREVKSQEELTKSSIAIGSQNYEGDSKDGINIDDLKDNQKAGGTQVPPKEEEVVDNAIVEVQATYPGGEAALLKFVSENLVYPAIAQEQDLQGVVTLRFRVEKDGSIGEIRIVKSLSKECDQAAAKVVKKLKRFTPARQQGHPVPVWFTLPVRFRIQ